MDKWEKKLNELKNGKKILKMWENLKESHSDDDFNKILFNIAVMDGFKDTLDIHPCTKEYLTKEKSNADSVKGAKLIGATALFNFGNGDIHPVVLFCKDVFIELLSKFNNSAKEVLWFINSILHELWHYRQFKYIIEKEGAEFAIKVTTTIEAKFKYGESPIEKGANMYGDSLGEKKQDLEEMLVEIKEADKVAA